MDFNTYQRRAALTSKVTLIDGDPIIYPALGLGNEVGELLGKIKKLYRDHDGDLTADRLAEIVGELGDVQWYVAEIATKLGVELDIVATENLRKLADRQARGVIGGSGDHR